MLVRMTATDVLEKAGFQVLEMENADAALAMLDACWEEVQVLFTDVNMPGSMDGIELAAHQVADLVRLRPATPRRDSGS
jgi:CheY-like chemotaxis protein